MGGFGSGRPGTRIKTEDCWSLDVNWLHREDCLVPGYQGRLRWSQGVGIKLQCDSTDELVLSYQLRCPESAPKAIEVPVPLTWSPCRHGGTRPYFLCPGERNGRSCWQRVVKLYLSGGHFRCRDCHGLCYASQSEARHYRLIRRRDKLLASLTPRGGEFDLEPPRPKGMWQRTYEARLAETRRLKEEADALFAAILEERFADKSPEDLPS